MPVVLANLLTSALDLKESVQNSNMSGINVTDKNGNNFGLDDIVDGLE